MSRPTEKTKRPRITRIGWSSGFSGQVPRPLLRRPGHCACRLRFGRHSAVAQRQTEEQRILNHRGTEYTEIERAVSKCGMAAASPDLCASVVPVFVAAMLRICACINRGISLFQKKNHEWHEYARMNFEQENETTADYADTRG